jgi:aminopeptidase N
MLVTGPGRPDIHSHGNFDRVCVTHIGLIVACDLDNEQLHIVESIKFKRMPGCPKGEPLVLDTKGQLIQGVMIRGRKGGIRPAHYTVGEYNDVLGAPLTVELPADACEVEISYFTGSNAQALQWLPERPGRKGKFMFSQGQCILTRSWVILQDCPAVRITYDAQVTVPHGLTAVMGADHVASDHPDTFNFRMPISIPPYLIAIAVGELAFRELGPRTGVYAEPDVVDKAAWEFADAERMLEAAESLAGPYDWGRFDVLVLPLSFPFGGMENPKLAFLTPTLLAGDRSLVFVNLHELFHSWAGNKVTNAAAEGFFLNEGLTTYYERRGNEVLYGKEVADMRDTLGLEELFAELNRLEPRDQILVIDLFGRDADEGATKIPYEKGALFLRTLEQAVGRKRFDCFLRSYLRRFAFSSIYSRQFRDFLETHLLNRYPAQTAGIDVDEWLTKPGLPDHYAKTGSTRLDAVDKAAFGWLSGKTSAQQLPWSDWTSDERVRFLRAMPKISYEQMAELDAAFGISNSTNAEVLFLWLRLTVSKQYIPAYNQLHTFLSTVGRRKFILPLYRDLAQSPSGKEGAQEIFRRYRHAYHPMLINSIEGFFRNDNAVVD